jgi:DNA polymerase family A
MITIKDTIAGDPIRFYYVESRSDLSQVAAYVSGKKYLALDTEATWANCYRRGWALRTFQCGDDMESYVVPAKWRKFIGWCMAQPVKWIAWNGPHDIRSIDWWLGYETGVVCDDMYIPAHHVDSRGRDEGGVGHRLKDQAVRFVDRNAGKWEKALTDQKTGEFSKLRVDIPGEVYKSGPRRGQQKSRKARKDECWGLVDPTCPAYIAYAASDPVLTFRLAQHYAPVVRQNNELYRFDRDVQEGYSRLQRRAMRLDVSYTERLSAAYDRKSHRLRHQARLLGCNNVQSGDQVAAALIDHGVVLRAKTDTGKWKTDAELLRKIAQRSTTPAVAKQFIRVVLGAKQVEKRRKSYTEAMLLERDKDDRVHPSIRSLAARTTRSSVAGPPFQQLPTKDHEDDVQESWEEGTNE